MMQIPTEWMSSKVAKSIYDRLTYQQGGAVLFSYDRYNYVGDLCPSMRTRLMLDNNTFLFLEL